MKLDIGYKYGLEAARGLVVTLKNFLRGPFTVQYPEERLPLPARFRANEFVWYQTKCTGCATCAKACPQGNIQIVTHFSEDARYIVDKFDIELGRCIFCGLCVEACPFDALYFGSSYEKANYRFDLLTEGLPQHQSPERKPGAYAHDLLERERRGEGLDPDKVRMARLWKPVWR